jgi:hypothetical protein
MPRETVPPTKNKHGDEVHPAWGMITAHRVSSTPGAVLFDSDIRHGHYVTVKISTGSRQRDLNRDWVRSGQQLIEVAMSEAQWASFVSSMNTSGVPCTLLQRESDWDIPNMPYEPRLQESMDEVKDAATGLVEKIRESFAKVDEAFEANAGKKALREAIRDLYFAIENAPANMTYAASSLNEHAENVVQKARADIEAMVISKAQQLGLEPGDITGIGELMAAPEEDA